MQKQRERRREDRAEEGAQKNQPPARDSDAVDLLEESDDIIAKIDAILEEELVEEMTFAEKARAWAGRQPRLNSGWKDDPCAERRAEIAEALRQGYRIAPPGYTGPTAGTLSTRPCRDGC